MRVSKKLHLGWFGFVPNTLEAKEGGATIEVGCYPVLAAVRVLWHRQTEETSTVRPELHFDSLDRAGGWLQLT